MSFDAETWAWGVPCPSHSAKTVLAYLGYRTNQQTGDAWPSIAKICCDTGLSEKTVRTALRLLVRAGLLMIEHRSGSRGCLPSRYRLAVGRAPSAAEDRSEGACGYLSAEQQPGHQDALTPCSNCTLPRAEPPPSPQQFYHHLPSGLAPTPLVKMPGKLSLELIDEEQRELTERGLAVASPMRARALPPQSDSREAAKPTRPHRLPEGWQPSPMDVAFAASRGLSPAAIDDAADEFRDFWRAAPKGTKLDWSATWRGRVRELERRNTSRPLRNAERPWRNGMLEKITREGGILFPEYNDREDEDGLNMRDILPPLLIGREE